MKPGTHRRTRQISKETTHSAIDLPGSVLWVFFLLMHVFGPVLFVKNAPAFFPALLIFKQGRGAQTSNISKCLEMLLMSLYFCCFTSKIGINFWGGYIRPFLKKKKIFLYSNQKVKVRRIRKLLFQYFICFIEVTGVTGGKGHGNQMLYMFLEVKTHQRSYVTVMPMIYNNSCQTSYVHLHNSNTIMKLTSYSLIGTWGPLQRDNYISGTVNSGKKERKKETWLGCLRP